MKRRKNAHTDQPLHPFFVGFFLHFIDDVHGICSTQRALSLLYLSAGKQKIASFFPLMRLRGAVCISQTQKQGPCADKMSRRRRWWDFTPRPGELFCVFFKETLTEWWGWSFKRQGGKRHCRIVLHLHNRKRMFESEQTCFLILLERNLTQTPDHLRSVASHVKLKPNQWKKIKGQTSAWHKQHRMTKKTISGLYFQKGGWFSTLWDLNLYEVEDETPESESACHKRPHKRSASRLNSVSLWEEERKRPEHLQNVRIYF